MTTAEYVAAGIAWTLCAVMLIWCWVLLCMIATMSPVTDYCHQCRTRHRATHTPTTSQGATP